VTWLAETAMLAHGWRRWLLLIVAGAISALSVPPLFILPALFVGMPIWVWSLDGAEKSRGWRWIVGPAFRIGLAFGMGYFTVALHWIGVAFFIEGGVMLVLMPFAVLGLAAILSIFWGLGSALAHYFWSDSPWRVVTLAVFVAAAEWARGHFFSGFPFDLFGYALTANDDMAQIASVIGIYGMTLVAVLLAFTPALIWPADGRTLARRLVPFFSAIVLIVGELGYGHYRLANTPVTPRTDMHMRLIQPVATEHENWATAKPDQIIQKMIDLSQTKTNPADPGLAGITQLVWPESSLPFFFSDYPDGLARIGHMLPKTTTLLTGAPRDDFTPGDASSEPKPGYNALLAINNSGEVIASYDKSHLVPFGEYLPFPQFFALFGLTQFVPGANGWAPGDGRRLVTAAGTPPFLALICYEAVFSGDLGDEISKAQFILNITNDSWFDGSIGPAQHANHARIRAIEEGLPMVRAANSGLTFLTDPLGRITASITPGEVALLDVVPDNRLDGTIFSKLRYWPFGIAELAGLAVAVLRRRRHRRLKA
jgi:apolipoprotein N-acyltransferase